MRIIEDVRSVFKRDPAARNVFEILTCYSGVQAVIIYRFTNLLWRYKLYWLARFISTFARWVTGIEIHPGAVIGRRFFIDHGMGVVIGETAIIGDDCTLYHGVTLGGTAWKKGNRHPCLKDGVVIGAGAKVLGPIVVGKNARIGSNSVVLKDVPKGVTVVGIPAYVVERRVKKPSAKRDAIANKMGFDAYGTANGIPDPVSNAINKMLDHIHLLDGQIEGMKKVLNKAGIEYKEEPIPELEVHEIDDGSGKH
jgi:serine O-acetyltransferase